MVSCCSYSQVESVWTALDSTRHVFGASLGGFLPFLAHFLAKSLLENPIFSWRMVGLTIGAGLDRFGVE